MDANFYNNEQLTLVVVDKICAVLSITGSSFMGRDIYKRWQNSKGGNAYLPPTSYILSNMCVADILYSFFPHFLGPWMTPKESGDPMATGNYATCKVQGIITVFSLLATLNLSTMLAITYWLTVCRGKIDSELTTWKWRAFLYFSPWTVALVWTLASTRVVKPSDFEMHWQYCMAAFSEPGTLGYQVWGIISSIYGFSAFIVICSCMANLILFVHQAEKRMDRFMVGGNTNRIKTIAASKQGLCYIVAFLFLLIPTTVYVIHGVALGKTVPGWVWTLTSWAKTLTGLSNSIIYFYPKYKSVRRQDNLSRLGALVQVLQISGCCCLSSLWGPRDKCIQGTSVRSTQNTHRGSTNASLVTERKLEGTGPEKHERSQVELALHSTVENTERHLSLNLDVDGVEEADNKRLDSLNIECPETEHNQKSKV